MRKVEFNNPTELDYSIECRLQEDFLYSDFSLDGEFFSIRYIPYIEKVYCLFTGAKDSLRLGVLACQDNVDRLFNEIGSEFCPINLKKSDCMEEDFVLFRDRNGETQVYYLADSRLNYISLIVDLFSKNRDKGNFTIVVNKGSENIVINHYVLSEYSAITRYDIGGDDFVITGSDDVSELLFVFADRLN